MLLIIRIRIQQNDNPDSQCANKYLVLTMLLSQDSSTPSQHQHSRILKSFYNKDASDSVTKSFLSLHTNSEQHFQLNETSSLSSLSSASISNKYALYVVKKTHLTWAPSTFLTYISCQLIGAFILFNASISTCTK